MKVPNWWQAVLLIGAAWRIYQLFAWDSIFAKPRRYVTGLGWSWQEGMPLPLLYKQRQWLVQFIECPYCFGFWVALAWFVGWEIWPHGALVLAAPFFLSAGVIGLHKILASE